ncbi:cytochrome P450 [Striga asiatica]|uniref:Cytochrome P450 n=1 Tax=Striga asiatica TaxID=4170 RepID=A0A5A7QFD5_STRAF|nr:cytochrome P450 [Striga asiatica]
MNNHQSSDDLQCPEGTYLYLELLKQASWQLRKLSPKIDCLISFYKNRRRLLTWYTDLLSQSQTQTIVVHRLGAPRTIVTANPANVEYILKTNFPNFPKGKPFTDLLGDFLGLGIFNSDGDTWRAQRKLASHAFSARSLRTFSAEILRDEIQTRLIPTLDCAATSDAVVDMQEILKQFAFDAVFRVSLGADPPPTALAAAFDAASEISAARGAAPVYAVWKAKRMLGLGRERELKEAVSTVRGCVEDIVRSRRENNNNNNNNETRDDSLLSRFVESGLGDDRMVRDMMISFVMAGRDTTSSAVTWLLWLLTRHREIELRVVDEVSDYDYEKFGEMKYVKACLCESMRLYPPVAWDSKHAAEKDVLPDGTRVGKGDRVTYFPYGMGRMKRIWGEDWMEFRPERWMEGRNVSPYEYPVFQAGPRVCLGKEMAFVQMKCVVAAILGRFELEPVREEVPVFVPLLTACMAGGFPVRVRRREL